MSAERLPLSTVKIKKKTQENKTFFPGNGTQ